jgi:hypothetical protein
VVTELHQLKTTYHVKTDVYTLERIKCDIGGVAVLVHKQDGSNEQYHVHLDKIIGDSCTCPGGTYKAPAGISIWSARRFAADWYETRHPAT